MADAPECAGWSRSGFDPARANYYETLFTVGNGRLGTRGSLEEGHRGRAVGHLSSNGVYDGHDVPVIDLVNAPGLAGHRRIRRRGPPRRRHLHGRRPRPRPGPARRPALPGRTVFEDAEGRRTRLETVRCASMADRRICALRVEVTPGEPRGGDRGRERDRRRASQPRAAAASTPRARCSRRRPGGRSGPGPSTCASRPGRPTSDASTWRCARSTSAWTWGTPPRRRSTRRRSTGRFASATSGSPEQTVHRPGGTVRMDKLVAICTSRDPGRPATVRDRCRAVLRSARGGFDRGGQAEPRGVVPPVGRV